MRNAIRALAIARLTTLVVDDKITEPLRMPILQRGGMLGYLVDCHKCVSIWAAASVLLAEQNKVGRVLVEVLAGSQVALAGLAMIEKVERS